MERRRGLGSLIPGAGGSSAEVSLEVPLGAIKESPMQPRLSVDAEGMAELAASVREHGVIQPLVVRRVEGGYELIAGMRRLEAARRAGLGTVPVVVRECGPREALELALVENLQREDINPVEAAMAYQRLIDEFGLTQEDVSARVGKSRSAVANTVRLLTLAKGVQERILTGELSEGHGRALLPLPEGRQLAALEQVVRRGLSVRQTEELVGKLDVDIVSRETMRARDPNLVAVEERLSSRLGTRVRMRERRGRGRIVIEYFSREERERLIGELAGE